MQYRPFLTCCIIPLLILISGQPASAQFSRQDFRKLAALTGAWQMPQPPGLLYEIWKKSSDTLLLGRSFSVRGKDTIPQETIRLAWNRGTITYTPTVVGQNGGLPVTFTLKSIGDSGFLFENPAHDFPQAIRYMPSGDMLFATISGNTSKGHKSIRYTYTRPAKEDAVDAMAYFRGRWKLKAWLSAGGSDTAPDISATWFVSGILENVTCLSGQVQLAGGKLFTSELIAFDPAKGVYVRTIASADSSYFSFTTKGWQGNKLTWTGTQSTRGGTVPMRQEIVRKSPDAFSAVFYVRRKDEWVRSLTEELERISK